MRQRRCHECGVGLDNLSDFCGGCRPSDGDSSYEQVYGSMNPWVRWLKKNAPLHLKKTPRDLRGAMGVPPVDVPGLDGKRQID